MNARWLIILTLIGFGFAYGTIEANQRIGDAQRAAAIIAAREAQDRVLTLCRGSNTARREVNRLGRALDAYLSTAVRINHAAERLHPSPPILRPLLRQELRAVARLRGAVHPVPLTACRAVRD